MDELFLDVRQSPRKEVVSLARRDDEQRSFNTNVRNDSNYSKRSAHMVLNMYSSSLFGIMALSVCFATLLWIVAMVFTICSYP